MRTYECPVVPIGAERASEPVGTATFGEAIGIVTDATALQPARPLAMTGNDPTAAASAVAAPGVGATSSALRSVLTRRPANIERPTITVHRTLTNDPLIPGAVRRGVDTPSAARPSRPTRTNTNNPVRISRIGSDRLQVFIRPAYGCRELLALVDRLEQLIDAGYDAIDVVFEAAPSGLSAVRDEPVRPRGAPATRNDSGISTDAKHPLLTRA